MNLAHSAAALLSVTAAGLVTLGHSMYEHYSQQQREAASRKGKVQVDLTGATPIKVAHVKKTFPIFEVYQY